MCLAVPAEVIELLDGDHARVDMGGVRKVVCTSLLEELRIGEYVIVHVGYALARIDAAEAQRTLELFAELFPARDEGAG